MTDFGDIFKDKFLEEFSAIALSDILVGITLSFLLSLYIVYIYKVTYAGVHFSRGFVGTIIMLSMVTTVVILVISSNVVLSLGMVGALSIVRFRTAVKEASDTAFLFWAIATGILCGAGYVTVSILATILLGLLFVLVHALGKHSRASAYLLVGRYDGVDAEKKLRDLPGYRLKNKTLSAAGTELVAEVRLSEKDRQAVEAMKDSEGIQEISLMASVGGSAL